MKEKKIYYRNDLFFYIFGIEMNRKPAKMNVYAKLVFQLYSRRFNWDFWDFQYVDYNLKISTFIVRLILEISH